MANFVHEGTTPSPTSKMKPESNVNGLFKRKNEQSTSRVNSAVFEGKSRMRKFGLKSIMGVLVLFLLLVGGVSAFILSQTGQDVRQQASGCVYWNGEAAVEGAFDNRGGIRQQCKNGLWSTPSDGNTNPNTGTLEGVGEIASSNDNGVSSSVSSSSCSGGQIYCAGCIQGCKEPTQTCNQWIDAECAVDGCGGRGVFPAAGEQCCPGLTQCANGRCDIGCPLDNNPICAGIREGSDCNNGGRWVCDSTEDGGSGHCDGGVWNTDEGADRVACTIAGQIVYYESQAECTAAKESAAQFVGGIADFITDAIDTGTDLIAQATVQTESSETHTKRCDLSGTIVYVTADEICEAYGGNPANGFVGPCCVDGEYESLCRPEERDSTPSSAADCEEKPGWVGPCCVDGEYKSLCRPDDRDYLPSTPSDCTASAGKGCGVNHDTQCVEGTLYECMNEEWVDQGNCAYGGPGPLVSDTCYYLGVNKVCTPSIFSLAPGSSCDTLSNFTSDSNCDDLREERGILNIETTCYYKSGSNCLSIAAQLRPGETCSDENNAYYDDANCGLTSSGPDAYGIYAHYPDCLADRDDSSETDFCKRVDGGYQLVEYSVLLNDVAEPEMEFISCYTDVSGCTTTEIEVEEGEVCRTYGYTSQRPAECDEMGPVEGPDSEPSEFSWSNLDPRNWSFSWLNFSWWSSDSNPVPGEV